MSSQDVAREQREQEQVKQREVKESEDLELRDEAHAVTGGQAGGDYGRKGGEPSGPVPATHSAS